jgi:O-antigen/teichoic acid export membrane protein
VLLISAVLGPVPSAVFAACRTLSRLPVQPLTILLSSLNPELTELIAKRQFTQLNSIVRKLVVLAMSAALLLGVGSSLFIGDVERVWLAGKLTLSLRVLIPLSLAATAYIGGQVLSQAMAAANQTRAQSKQFMISSVLMLALMLPLLLITKQLMWAAIAVLVSEGWMLVALSRRYKNYVTN